MNVVDLAAIAGLLECLADGNKAQQILDRWPKPADERSRLAAHWVPTGQTCDAQKGYHPLIDEAYATLAATDDPRNAAHAVRATIANAAHASGPNNGLADATATVNEQQRNGKIWQQSVPALPCACPGHDKLRHAVSSSTE
ncbi:hypothetical protein SEUCBS139899_001710 [Sporothrix eucalyptigena]